MLTWSKFNNYKIALNQKPTEAQREIVNLSKAMSRMGMPLTDKLVCIKII